jgi:hypothetical protein
LIGILGMFPPTPTFAAVELHDMANREEYRSRFPQLEGLVILQNSDAHALEQMNLEPPDLELMPSDDSDQGVRNALISHLRAKNI